MLKIDTHYPNAKAIEFCHAMKHSQRPKYVLGRTSYAQSICKALQIEGFIDEFTDETNYMDKPIVPIDLIPDNALVVSSVIGKPLIAEKRLSQFQFDSLDYYSFYKYSGLPLQQIMFWEGMQEDIRKNYEKYVWIYEKLHDKTSKNQFYHIINFRLSYDLNYMRGFEDQEDKQYFEHFLALQEENESFADIGAFDGYTSEVFIRHSPNFDKIYIFEPEQSNMLRAKQRLAHYNNIEFHQIGLSDKRETLKFDINGSSSSINSRGEISIHVDRLDAIIQDKITFLKMDIEGFESNAIEGAKETIKKYHPRLAISVYHKKDDFWKIPEQVLRIREDYDIYLRHYTQGISETIMFFMPKKGTR